MTGRRTVVPSPDQEAVMPNTSVPHNHVSPYLPAGPGTHVRTVVESTAVLAQIVKTTKLVPPGAVA
ncbi:MAG: hypothetical protein QOG80_1055 [Pseudonocardiales bacterium]|nr:hypothetical protein [Pseudonocardiales bacterium]